MIADPGGRVLLDLLFASLPNEWPDDGLTAAIERQVAASPTKIVVLDDDPTGTQTVHDVLVVTDWSQETLTAALAGETRAVFILTNSRSVPLAQAQAMNRQIAENLGAVARRLGCPIEVISRSDSTLRGHFPGEVDALCDGLEQSLGVTYDGYIIAPALLEAGRYTANNAHWVRENEWAIPAAQTEFARDASFGYRSSDLRNWVEEKTGGRVAAASVVAVTHADVRGGGPERVASVLGRVVNRGVAIANIASYQDVAVFVAGLLQAEAQGKRFICRTAASFVRVRAGVSQQPLLTAERLYTGGGERCGGLIVAGSYIQKSSEQLNQLLALPGVAALEINVPRVLDERLRQDEIARVIGDVNRLLPERDVVVMTSRQLVTGDSKEESLQIGAVVSAALVAVVRGLTVRPRFVVAKGGITSSDIATQALNIKRALVLGQIAPAVPVWQPAEGSRFPGVPYVVFPGNVGGADTLADVVQTLHTG
jgi:uncharacterized protein YgbK (DUF1537 family)